MKTFFQICYDDYQNLNELKQKLNTSFHYWAHLY